MPKKSRAKPSDPAAIALAAAAARAAERQRAKDPESWAIANDTIELPTGAGMAVHRSKHKREVFARRLDPFQSLYRAGSLTGGQHQASERLFRDWCISQGIRTDDPRPALELIDMTTRGPSDLVNCRMIDARDRLEEVLERVGLATRAVLLALISPAVMCGTVLIWRAEVERVTGETHTHAQSSVVRRACEDLRLAYETLDRRGAQLQQAVSQVA